MNYEWKCKWHCGWEKWSRWTRPDVGVVSGPLIILIHEWPKKVSPSAIVINLSESFFSHALWHCSHVHHPQPFFFSFFHCGIII